MASPQHIFSLPPPSSFKVSQSQPLTIRFKAQAAFSRSLLSVHLTVCSALFNPGTKRENEEDFSQTAVSTGCETLKVTFGDATGFPEESKRD